MEKGMERQKNMMIMMMMVNYYLKENIQMEKEMDLEKNINMNIITILINISHLFMKEIIRMGKKTEKEKNMMGIIKFYLKGNIIMVIDGMEKELKNMEKL